MTLLLTHADVVDLCRPDIAYEAVRRAFELEGRDQIGRPTRSDIPVPKGWLRLMAVSAPGLNAFGFKAMNLTPGIGVRYSIWVYDADSGALRALLDAKALTGVRTAATTALASTVLGRDGVGAVAIVGTGFEAREHLVAFHRLHPDAVFSIYSRSAANRDRFAHEMDSSDRRLTMCASLDEAVDGVDVAVLATKSPAPFFEKRHLRPGLHVNSVGAARHDQFELHTESFGAFDVVVCDSATSVMAEAGDAMAAVAAGTISLDEVHNLCDIVAGSALGRSDPQQITLFKSVGTAVQDLALAVMVTESAEARGLGTQVDGFPTLKPI